MAYSNLKELNNLCENNLEIATPKLLYIYYTMLENYSIFIKTQE